MSLTTTTWTLVAGAVFGLALAAPPGPMNAVIAEESVLRGWLAGFPAGLGAMTADFVFFVLSLAGVVAFLDSAPTVRAVMIAAGGVLMLYFASGAARD
ncbi:lysine transporter LysE, partial [Halobacteriales archaeon QH_6_68_27]